MTAFAAILALDGDRDAAHHGSAAVAAVLSATSGTPTRAWRTDVCALLTAPLHSWDPTAPVALNAASIAAAGQVMIEARDELVRALQLPSESADLELVAAAYARWQTDFAQHLRGEYACALWDGRERHLTCARDPLGIRPLYVGNSARLVIVSNVIDAVTAHPAISKDLDDAALARFLATGALTSSVATAYRAIRMVPEGHTLTIPAQGVARLTRHWQPAPVRRLTAQNDVDVVNAYRDVLGKAVRDRVGRRACTIFLSGGVDSTSLAATAVECTPNVRAVTFAYKGIALDDEVSTAREVAEGLSIAIDVIDGDAAAALEAERRGDGPALPVDEPSLSNWRAGLHAAATYSTLAVIGEDGDALFRPPGGSALLAVQPAASVLRETLVSLASERHLPYLGLRLRERIGWTRTTAPDPSWLLPEARRIAALPEEPTILGQTVAPLAVDPQAGPAWERLLRNVPRTFAVSISPDVTRERLAVTLPLMDTRVIEYVLSVPPIPWRQDKRLARAAFVGRLPPQVLNRRKTPAAGLDAATVLSWRRRYLDAQVTARAIEGMRWVDAAGWRHALEHGSPRVTMAAWRVLMLDAWLTRASRNILPCTA